MNKLFDISKSNSADLVEQMLNEIVERGHSNIKLTFSKLGMEPKPNDYCYYGPVVYIGQCLDEIKSYMLTSTWLIDYGYTIDSKRKLVYPWYNKPEELVTLWYPYEGIEDNGFDIVLAYEYNTSEELLKIVRSLRKNMSSIDPKLRDTNDCNAYELKDILMQ